MDIAKDDVLAFLETGFSFRSPVSFRDVPQLLQETASSWLKDPHCGQYIRPPMTFQVERNTGKFLGFTGKHGLEYPRL